MIFIAGPHCSGKTEVASFLSKYNFYYLDLGPVLRTIYANEGSFYSFGEWCKNNTKKYGEDYINDILTQEINKNINYFLINNPNINDMVIVGNRSLNGIKYIQNNSLKLINKKDIIIYLSAPKEILRERYYLREKIITDEEFHLLLKKDLDLGLESIIGSEDYNIINDDSLISLYTKIIKILKELDYNLEVNKNEK